MPLAGSKLGEEYSNVSYLGKSEKGVYSALLYRDDARWPHFRVWLLINGQKMEWVLRSDISLQAMVENFATCYSDNRYNKPWIRAGTPGSAPAQENEIEELDDEWNFDNGGIVLETKDDEARRHWPNIRFLGFHPYKEIALFCTRQTMVLSYQLNTSKVKELGYLIVPIDTNSSFLYTQCMLDVGGLRQFENN